MLPEAHHVALCSLYHLRRFVHAAPDRREQYFLIVAEAPATLQRVLGVTPSEQDVLSWIGFVLGKDRTFLPHVSKHGGTSMALKPDEWRLVLEAGAGAIVGEYLISLESGKLR